MSQGVILLILIALIIAYVVTRTRRRMGLLVTGRTWLYVGRGRDARHRRPVGSPEPLTCRRLPPSRAAWSGRDRP